MLVTDQQHYATLPVECYCSRKPRQARKNQKSEFNKMEIQRSGKGKSKYSWLGMSPGVTPYTKTEESCVKECICHRKRGLISCTKCQKSFMGRIGARCPVHPEIAYLMDARNCAFCGAATQYLQMNGSE